MSASWRAFRSTRAPSPTRFGVETEFPAGDFRDWYFRGDRKQQVVEHVEPLRKDLAGANLADIALRFCLSHPAVSTVIPGMRTVRHAESNTALSDQPPNSPPRRSTCYATTPGTATSTSSKVREPSRVDVSYHTLPQARV